MAEVLEVVGEHYTNVTALVEKGDHEDVVGVTTVLACAERAILAVATPSVLRDMITEPMPSAIRDSPHFKPKQGYLAALHIVDGELSDISLFSAYGTTLKPTKVDEIGKAWGSTRKKHVGAMGFVKAIRSGLILPGKTAEETAARYKITSGWNTDNERKIHVGTTAFMPSAEGREAIVATLGQGILDAELETVFQGSGALDLRAANLYLDYDETFADQLVRMDEADLSPN